MRKIFLASFVLAFLFSCQPEFPPPSNWNAEGSLSDSLGNCYNSLVEGVYLEGSPLTSSEYIDVFANFTTTGSYEVKTDTLNGYYFIGSGTVSTTGLKAIRLTGFGQPSVAGSDTFHMRLNNSVCEVIVEVLSSTTPPAEISFTGSGGPCSGAVLAGTYIANTAMTSSNTVSLNVTVTSPGPYNINTTTFNGVSFSASGMATTSTSSIVLTATGTPLASPTDTVGTYTVSLGASSCTFNVIYTGAPAGPASFTMDCATLDATFPVTDRLVRVGQILDPFVDTVTVQVNVITPGSYTISTAYGLGGPDGVNFNTSGVFTNAGVQTLRLGARGTAGRGGFVFYNLSSPQATNATPCTTGAYYENLYLFGGSTSNNNFTFLSNVVNDNSSIAGYDLIKLKGYSSATATENVELTIGLPTGGDFNTISGPDVIYTTNNFQTQYVKAVYTDNSNPSVVYSAETNGITQASPFTITIKFCTSIRIEGTFSGIVKDNNGAGPGTKNISGRFGLRRS